MTMECNYVHYRNSIAIHIDVRHGNTRFLKIRGIIGRNERLLFLLPSKEKSDEMGVTFSSYVVLSIFPMLGMNMGFFFFHLGRFFLY